MRRDEPALPTEVMRTTMRAVVAVTRALGWPPATDDPAISAMVAGYLGLPLDEADARMTALEDYLDLPLERQRRGEEEGP